MIALQNLENPRPHLKLSILRIRMHSRKIQIPHMIISNDEQLFRYNVQISNVGFSREPKLDFCLNNRNSYRILCLERCLTWF